VAIQQVLRQSNIGAGGTLRALEQRLYADHARDAAAPAATGVGLPPLRGAVRPEWIDYNGHMTDSRYQQVFGDVMDALCRRIGIDEDYRQRVGMYYTVESHTTHGVELKVGDPYEVRTRILAVDDKRLRLFHALHRTRDGALVATGEQMHLHVGVKAGKTVPVADAIRVQLERFRDAQAKEPLPPQAGRAIGQAPKG
jgi:carnitine 3-dehydrogenase